MPKVDAELGVARDSNVATMAAPRTTARHATIAPPADDLVAGMFVDDRYELVRELGTGATGVVWEAKHRILTKHVAIKFLNPQPEFAGESVLTERFRYEAQVSARLAEHTPHIVAVHDTSIFKGRHYIVMDLASGRSVETQLDLAPLSPRGAWSLVRQIGDALRVAHREGIIHRDVKPANILIVDGPAGDEPLFKLADFGVAKGLRDSIAGAMSPTRTTSGLSIGSPAYMSPEQVQGQKVVDGDPDRWALATVAYEALTQQLPFDGENFAGLVRNIVACKFTPITEVVPGLPAELDAFFARAFAKDKASRFENVDAMLAAFESAVASPPSHVRAQSLVTPLPLGDPSRPSLPSSPSVPPRPSHEVSSPPPITKPSVPPSSVQQQRGQRSIGVLAMLGVAVLLLLIGTIAFRRMGDADRRDTATQASPVALEVVAPTRASAPAVTASSLLDPTAQPVPKRGSAAAPPSVMTSPAASAAVTAAATESAGPPPSPKGPRRVVDPSEVY